jgi:hypothetical protein
MNTTQDQTTGTTARAVRALLTTAALGAAAAGLLLAAASPAKAESAETTIGLLEAQGFDVRVDRIGSAPLDQCVVTDIRNPQQREFVDFDRRGHDRTFFVKRTVTVSLNCVR